MGYDHNLASPLPILLGFLSNALLAGIVFSQCTDYYIHSKRDPRWLKNYVGLVFLMDVADTIICATTLYLFAVMDRSVQVGRFTRISYFGITLPALTGLISCAVQLFFIYRIHRLRENIYLTVPLAVASVSQCLFGIMLAAMFKYGRPVDLDWMFVVWLGLVAATDVMIAAILVDYLKENTTGYTTTDDLISKIVRATLQTGVILTTWAISHLIVITVMTNDVHIFFAATTSKLYTISLFSLLNARSRWNETNDNRWNPTLPSIPISKPTSDVPQNIPLYLEEIHVIIPPTVLHCD